MLNQNNGKLILSYSGTVSFLECRRKYWYTYIRNLEPISFNKAFFTGAITHNLIANIYKKVEFPLATAFDEIAKTKAELVKTLLMTDKIAQDFEELNVVVEAIYIAYKERNTDLIDRMTSIANEYEVLYPLSENVIIKAFLDNILFDGSSYYVHELKTTRQLTEDYIKNVQNSLQTNLYFYLYNLINKDAPLQGILYDIIKKPSIRLKKAESYQQFLQRLIDHYAMADDCGVFHMELIKHPILTQERVLNTVNRVANAILELKDEEEFYCNDTFCYVHSRCKFYDICHFGENATTLARFKERKERTPKEQIVEDSNEIEINTL